MSLSRLLKIIGISVAGVLGIVLLLVAAIVLLVDPNDYRDDITSVVQDATGRELNIKGELHLSVFPWLGLSLGETRLSNAPGFAEKDFARVSSVDINVKLLPLLQQRIEMKTLHLNGLRVNLSRAADGRTNWDDLLAAPGETAEPAQTTPAEQPSAGSPAPALAFAIGGVNIEDAQIVWDDKQAGQHVEVKPLSLRTGPIALGEPIDIHLRTQISLSEPALQTPIEFDGRISADPETQRYRLDGMKLSLNLRSELLPVSPLNVGLTGNVDADLAQQQAKISGLQLRTLGLSSKVEATIENLLSTPQAKGQLSVAKFSAKDLSKTLGIALPKMADAKALGKVSAKLEFDGSPDAVVVNNLQVVLDDSHLSGKLRAEHFAQPKLGFNLKLDAIDVDRYLPPASAKQTPPAATPATAAAASAQLPLEPLRALDVKGELNIGKLKAANARVADIVLGLNAQGGKIRLQPLQASLYQGQYNGHVELDVRKDTPKISADEKLNSVHIGPLLKDVLGEDKVSGTANLAAKVTAVGITAEAITQTLNGSANFSFKDGAVKGVNIGQLIREAYAKIKNKPKPPKTTNQTDFAAVSGSVTIHNGVVSNQDLRASSPALRVAGKGSVDLPKQRINYLLNTSIVETDEGQGGKELAELKSLTIPIKITGTFDKPKFALDLAPVLKAKAKAKIKKEKKKLKKKVEKKVEEKKEEVKQKLEDKLKDKLKGLFR
jgi:AsmA protein